MFELKLIKRTHPRLLRDMENHYSRPRGFVGRNLCYGISYNGVYYGSVVGGSATLFLPGRDEFFGGRGAFFLENIVNNIFFHLERQNGKYPMRNFLPSVLRAFRQRIVIDWEERYGDEVIGFESLIEPPRNGEVYKRDGWTQVGITKGYTCKRVSTYEGEGYGTESISGKRVWDMENLRPKLVFVRRT